jgi:hypothetical protein
MDYVTDYGKLIYRDGLFEYTMRLLDYETCDIDIDNSDCECENCNRYRHGPYYCRLYVKNGKVMTYDEDITFRHYIRRWHAECEEYKNPDYKEFEALCDGDESARTGLIEANEATHYINYYMHFEKYVIANYKPPGRFTKPALH